GACDRAGFCARRSRQTLTAAARIVNLKLLRVEDRGALDRLDVALEGRGLLRVMNQKNVRLDIDRLVGILGETREGSGWALASSSRPSGGRGGIALRRLRERNGREACRDKRKREHGNAIRRSPLVASLSSKHSHHCAPCAGSTASCGNCRAGPCGAFTRGAAATGLASPSVAALIK